MESRFLNTHMPVLLNRYNVSCDRDETCMHYYLCLNGQCNTVSRALILSYNIHAEQLYVSKFYPEIYRGEHSKYLSAACFYLIVNHSANIFGLGNTCAVHLETDRQVFDTFYSRLNEFNFSVCCSRPGDCVSVAGTYQQLGFGIDMITRHHR